VKSIPPDLMLLRYIGRDRIECGRLRNRSVKRGVEDPIDRHSSELFPQQRQYFDGTLVVQWSELFEGADFFFHLGVDQSRRIEIQSAVDDPYSNTVQLFKVARRPPAEAPMATIGKESLHCASPCLFGGSPPGGRLWAHGVSSSHNLPFFNRRSSLPGEHQRGCTGGYGAWNMAIGGPKPELGPLWLRAFLTCGCRELPLHNHVRSGRGHIVCPEAVLPEAAVPLLMHPCKLSLLHPRQPRLFRAECDRRRRAWT
jgi:hypothetical protein